MKTILITGFDPFGGEPINPAWEAVKLIDGYESNGYRVVAKMVPTVRRKSIEAVRVAKEEYEPEYILCVGQAGGRSDITVERVAINVDDFRIPDNEGNQPVDEVIEAEGAPAYFATLPVKAIVNELRQDGIPASVSNTAGTFVCNHIMYGLLHMIYDSHIKGGFMHIPYLPEQVVDKPGQPSMAKETVVHTLQILVDVLTGKRTASEEKKITYTTPHE